MSRLEARDIGTLHVGPVAFSIEAGACSALWGPSGAGKSLLLRALADLDPHEGEVFLGGDAQSSMPGPAWRRRVGYLPTDSAWWAPRVGDHFAGPVPAELGFGPDVAGWDVARLSSGERQRLALLRLLAREPESLLLDEPTANLDDQSARLVEALIERYRGKHDAAVLWVSHDAEQRARVATKEFSI